MEIVIEEPAANGPASVKKSCSAEGQAADTSRQTWPAGFRMYTEFRVSTSGSRSCRPGFCPIPPGFLPLRTAAGPQMLAHPVYAPQRGSPVCLSQRGWPGLLANRGPQAQEAAIHGGKQRRRSHTSPSRVPVRNLWCFAPRLQATWATRYPLCAPQCDSLSRDSVAGTLNARAIIVQYDTDRDQYVPAGR